MCLISMFVSFFCILFYFLSLNLFNYVFVPLSIKKSNVTSVCAFLNICFYPLIRLPTKVNNFISIYMSMCLSMHMNAYLPMYLLTFLSIHKIFLHFFSLFICFCNRLSAYLLTYFLSFLSSYVSFCLSH